ncbi:MAG: SUMF1/EgtB/PvdO family nonheme iron enzyme [Tenuifilaceae bacterium]|nr:SUMF1/EgtB/PvdO family nonheme iron enzyme [Tenuifilaceae bacterium]
MKRFSLVLILSFIAFYAVTQSISVKSFRQLENDLDARVHHPKQDQNGEVCAIIKVVTTQTGFTFDVGSLGVMGTEQKVGEVWVYVPRGVQRITIAHQKLGMLRNYAFTIPIQSAMVYELELTTARVTTIVEEPEILTQWLAINSTPTGANVFVEEMLVGTTPFTRKYPEGNYTYRIELPRYHSEAGKFSLKNDRKNLSFTMRPKFGNISVSSEPESGMQIYLNDENTGKTTPATLTEVASGNQMVKLMNQWYQPQAKSITVNDNLTTKADFIMQPAFADITIITEPTADILIDGSRKGNGTFSQRMLAGIYDLQAVLDKHTSHHQQLIVEVGKPQTITLCPKPRVGALDVTSTPFDAKIKLNGKDYGSTPTSVKDLLIGSYVLTLEKQGYGTVTKTITIAEGKDTEVNETLHSGMQVIIASKPTGAQLSINGSPAPESIEGKGSTTPWTGTLAFGNNTLRLVNGKKVVEEIIAVRRGGQDRWDYDVIEFDNFTETAANLNLEMVSVRGGTYTMGCISEKKGDCYPSEKPAHLVTVNDFYMGKYEVTQAQWYAIMGNNPSLFSGCDNCPVEQVSWYDIQEFLEKLNRITGKNYRLPSEAEWEYVAKGGVQSNEYKYAGSNNIRKVAWYTKNSEYKTHPVGSKTPNKLGIYDLNGNVWEWCNDWYSDSYYGSSSSINPQGPTSGSGRVQRGGSWRMSAGVSRITYRSYLDTDPSNRSNDVGFRLVLSVSQGEETRTKFDIDKNEGFFTDNRDSKTYKTVKIGSQVWMAENLAYEPNSGNYWTNDSNTSNTQRYGYLYDWQTACNVCPTGWHLPNDVEWLQLTDFVGNNTGVKLKAKSGWSSNGNGTDDFGFSALSGELLNDNGETFYNIGYSGSWWSATEISIDSARSLTLKYDSNDFGSNKDNKNLGFSVRCLKD